MNLKIDQSNKILIPFYKIIVLCFLINTSCTSGHQSIQSNSWQMVYENDSFGEPIYGEVDDLINSINEGKEVRVMIISKDQKHISEAENIWIKDGIVYVQNSSHIGVEFKEDKLFFQRDAYHWYYIISTKGDLIISRWLVGSHTRKGNDSTSKTAIKWFTR